MILTLASLKEHLAGSPDCRLVHAHGCFDVLHLGHVRHFEAAKKMGDVLVVTVTPDRFVNKGFGRPVFNQADRCEMIDALRCVDYVALNEWPTAVETINFLRPAVYVKGSERRTNTDALWREKCAVEGVGGRLELTDEPTFHSTDLLRALAGRDVYSEV